MWEFLKNLRDFLSLDYRSLFIIACISWVVFYVPEWFWDSLGLQNIRSIILPWVSTIGVISSLWFVFGGIFDLVSKGAKKINALQEPRKMQKTREEILLTTSEVERSYIAKYMSEDTTTIAFDARDGVVNGLIAKGILYQARQMPNPFSFDFDINVHPWVVEYLQKHPKVLENIEPIDGGRHQIRL